MSKDWTDEWNTATTETKRSRALAMGIIEVIAQLKRLEAAVARLENDDDEELDIPKESTWGL